MASFKQLSLNCVFEMAEWELILASALNCYMSYYAYVAWFELVYLLLSYMWQP